MSANVVRVGASGRVVLPAETRRISGIAPGDLLVVVPEPGGVRLITRAEAVRRAQALVAEFVAPGRSLAAELLVERRGDDGE
jgi:AbrB family looped-hinge helix DNA binding protein